MDSVALRRLGFRLLWIALGVAFAFLVQWVALSSGQFNSNGQRLFFLAGLYVTLAVSLNLINGITGQFSMGHAAFYQVGAYTTGVLAAKFYSDGAGLASKYPLPWLIGMMFAGGLVAALAGFIVGLPSLRLKGDYLAIVTLGFGEIIRIIVQNQKSLGGSYGMDVKPKIDFIWLSTLLAIATIAISRNLLKNVHGLAFLAVREDEVASSAMGVRVTRIKIAAFLLGSALAGAAGALLAHHETFISKDTFPMDLSFIIVTMVVLGGTGSITGSTLAAITLYLIPERMRDLKDVPVSYAALGVIMLIVTVAFVRRTMEKDFSKLRTVKLVAPWFVSIVVVAVGGAALKNVGPLSKVIDGQQLRFVIFALTLITLMLLRPQGIFAHHEFSLQWLKKVLARFTKRSGEVAS
ncbi:MAG: branched-chain amino acid ABC transporter permease [Armatimonadetes bacterium]|nr:branched-chain amino acid ABC transporter permease [Armatimonadota bacterium]